MAHLDSLDALRENLRVCNSEAVLQVGEVGKSQIFWGSALYAVRDLLRSWGCLRAPHICLPATQWP